MEKQNDWMQFYEDRVNSGYQQYFEERYKPMLDILKSQRYVFEEGIGIGSISKCLLKENIYCMGYDNNMDMVKLCRKNNPSLLVTCDTMLNEYRVNFYHNLIHYTFVTHGVLEHFTDDQIRFIFERYNNQGAKNIHYVPTDGYDSPSFGDERLLPVSYWLDLVKPKDYLTFNDNKDLLLINL